jgi:predicted Zn-dependent peptidase
MKKRLLLLLGIVIFGVFGIAATIPEKMVQEFTLDNGMHFIVVERHQFPTVSCIILFDVGAGDEPVGKTGMAHLLEHLMFKGSRDFGVTDWEKEKSLFEEANKATHEWISALDKTLTEHPQGVFKEDEKMPESQSLAAVDKTIKDLLDKEREYIIKDEFWGTYDRHGGSMQNAFTSEDSTGYFVVLPANKFELWAILESDRLKDAVFREFFSERDVVMEEKRRSDESVPDDMLGNLENTLAFPVHPYGRPVVGYWDDLRHLAYEDVQNFYNTYYRPNNCVAVVAGDITLPKVQELAKKYFEPLPKGAIPVRHWTGEPPLDGPRGGAVYFDAQPQIMLAYRVPSIGHPDFPALQLAANVLGRGESSRLNRRIVLDQKMAPSAASWCSPRKEAYLFEFNSTPFKDHTIEEIERAFREEVGKLAAEGPAEKELAKVKNQFHASTVYRLESPTWYAFWLAQNAIQYKDWRFGYRYLDRIDAVTADDIKRVLKKYVVPENEIRVVLMKKEKSQ